MHCLHSLSGSGLSVWRDDSFVLHRGQDDRLANAAYDIVFELSTVNYFWSMARPRAASGAEAPKEPHSVSLKGAHSDALYSKNQLTMNFCDSPTVSFKTDFQSLPFLTPVSLSRPSLSYQYPLPAANTKISAKASLSYPSNDSDDQFILTPIVGCFHPPAPSHLHVTDRIAHPTPCLRIRLRRRNLRLYAQRKQRAYRR